MRKLLLLAFFIATISVGSFGQRASTNISAADTVSWLEANVSSVTFPVKFFENKMLIADGVLEGRGVTKWNAMAWKDVKSISQLTCDNGLHPCIKIVSANDHNFIRLPENTPASLLPRIIAALTHLAELNGSKIVKDDSF